MVIAVVGTTVVAVVVLAAIAVWASRPATSAGPSQVQISVRKVKVVVISAALPEGFLHTTVAADMLKEYVAACRREYPGPLQIHDADAGACLYQRT